MLNQLNISRKLSKHLSTLRLYLKIMNSFKNISCVIYLIYFVPISKTNQQTQPCHVKRVLNDTL